MDYFRDEQVRCLGRAEWGPGRVEADSRDGKVRVSFQWAGRKVLSLKHAKIFKVRPFPTEPSPPAEAEPTPPPSRTFRRPPRLSPDHSPGAAAIRFPAPCPPEAGMTVHQVPPTPGKAEVHRRLGRTP